MRSLLFVALIGCTPDVRDAHDTHGDPLTRDACDVPHDSRSPGCPAMQPSGACSFHQANEACFYPPEQVCVCLMVDAQHQWQCTTIVHDAGIDAYIPPDAP